MKHPKPLKGQRYLKIGENAKIADYYYSTKATKWTYKDYLHNELFFVVINDRNRYFYSTLKYVKIDPTDDEDIIQGEAVKELRKLGCVCWVTSTNRKSRNTKGTPDVIVSLPRAKFGMCKALEFKSAKGVTTDEQRLEAIESRIVICRSVDDALKACGFIK